MTAGHRDGWMLPTRTDLDGSVLVLCHADFEAGTPTDAWSLWCPDCAAVVPGTALPGSQGLASVDGLPDDAYDVVAAHEARCSAEHAAAMCQGPPRAADAADRARLVAFH
jgi:hypothetical protein